MSDTTDPTGATRKYNLHDRIDTLTDSQADVMRATLALGHSLDMLQATLLLFMIGMGIIVIYHAKGQH